MGDPIEPRALDEEAVKALRAPFDNLGKLPRITCQNCRNAKSKVCSDHRKARCDECQNWITSAHIHLDYVGHAAVTDRLLSVDPRWNWEPCAWDVSGLPAIIEEQGGRRVFWIKLTVCDVTRLGVGIAGSKDEVEKELIGDALRNAAMRFGVALDLWAKEGLHGSEDPPAPSARIGAEPEAPAVDWEALGWDDEAQHQTARDAIASKVKSALDAEAREKLTDWWREQGWTWPLSQAQVAAYEDQIDTLAEVATDDADGNAEDDDSGRPFE